MRYYLLGLFAGDGWFQTRGIAIGTNKIEFANKIADLCENEFGKSKLKKRTYKDGHIIYIVFVWNKDVCEEFKRKLSTEKKKSTTFKIPDLSKKEMRDFVAGVFDAEATLYFWKNKPRIGLEIHNEAAARKIHETLRKDRIKCNISKCSRGEFKIDFTGKESVDRFFEKYNTFRLTPSSTGQSTL